MTRAGIIGTGLVGGSVGLALRRNGVVVRGYDRDGERAARALEMGAIDEAVASAAAAASDADLVVIAIPVSAVADAVVEALDAGAAIVTDVGSVKAPVVEAVEAARPTLAARYVGGHPMAGSEQDGLDGADADLFQGATWVLTPTERTDPDAFATVRQTLGAIGAEVFAVTPDEHDALVAMVSHVPQLAATTLMDVAATRGAGHALLLRLAAGGFRDMTRIAAGHPGIWPDICVTNRDAIVTALDEYVAALEQVRAMVVASDRSALLEVLDRARAARRSLPTGIPADVELIELHVPIADRPGSLAEVTTLAGTLGVNISDIEIAHSVEGRGGVLVLLIAAGEADRFTTALDRARLPRRPHDALVTADSVVITGPRPLRGRLRLPGEKGMSHRALVFGAVADGTTRVRRLAPGDDVARTAAALRGARRRDRARGRTDDDHRSGLRRTPCIRRAHRLRELRVRRCAS